MTAGRAAAPGAEAGSGVDLHNHLLPGVDDGARTREEARHAVEAMREQGVGTAVCTPHLRAGLFEQAPEAWWARLDDFGVALSELRAAAPDGFALDRGVELRLDAPPSWLEDDRVRLAGSRYVLVEFATLQLPGLAAQHLESVVEAGFVPLLAHPARYMGLEGKLGAVPAWRAAGVRLQVNAGSLVGQYGSRVRRVAWRLLEAGWADVVASDYHARGGPRVADARRALEQCDGGEEAADRLLAGNPARVLEDRELEEVPPVERPGPWGRLWSALTPG